MKDERIPIGDIVELVDSPSDLYSDYDYIVYIDESGDAAYDKMTDETGRGACDYLILGATIIKTSDREAILNDVGHLCKNFRKQINHIVDITKHYDKIYFYKELNKLPIAASFGLISYKSTLNNGKYKPYNPKKAHEFYHVALRLLLERINSYFREISVSAEQIVFIIEENNSFKLETFKNYMRTIKSSHPCFSRIEPNNFLSLSKQEDKLTILGDAISHALYHTVVGQFINKKRIVETRYLREIKKQFSGQEDRTQHFGRIKFIHNIDDVNLTDDAKAIFQGE